MLIQLIAIWVQIASFVTEAVSDYDGDMSNWSPTAKPVDVTPGGDDKFDYADASNWVAPPVTKVEEPEVDDYDGSNWSPPTTKAAEKPETTAAAEVEDYDGSNWSPPTTKAAEKPATTAAAEVEDYDGSNWSPPTTKAAEKPATTAAAEVDDYDGSNWTPEKTSFSDGDKWDLNSTTQWVDDGASVSTEAPKPAPSSVRPPVDPDRWKGNCTESGTYMCRNGNAIKCLQMCNQKDDCGDNSDEMGCYFPQCKPSEETIPRRDWCDTTSQCGNGADETGGSSTAESDPCSHLKPFKCNSKDSDSDFMAPYWRCDGHVHCDSGIDEKNCKRCQGANYQTFYAPEWECDGKDDCGDGTDEEGCDGHYRPLCTINNRWICQNGKDIYCWGLCNNIDDCGDQSDEMGCGYFTCANGDKIKNSLVCIGSRSEKDIAITKCPDSSDETNDYAHCDQKPWFECEDTELDPIPNGYNYRCDHHVSCLDGSDEKDCIRCRDNYMMLFHDSQRCDGFDHCGDGTDEDGCSNDDDSGQPAGGATMAPQPTGASADEPGGVTGESTGYASPGTAGPATGEVPEETPAATDVDTTEGVTDEVAEGTPPATEANNPEGVTDEVAEGTPPATGAANPEEALPETTEDSGVVVNTPKSL